MIRTFKEASCGFVLDWPAFSCAVSTARDVGSLIKVHAWRHHELSDLPVTRERHLFQLS